MDPFRMNIPSTIIFGSGKFREAGSHISMLNIKKAIIVTGRNSSRRNGYLAMLEEQLKRYGIDYTEFAEIEPNPRHTTINRGAELSRKKGADLVIGLGGGSAMDAAKGIAISSATGVDIWKYCRGSGTMWKDLLPLKSALKIVEIPTLAASGSEAGDGAVISNEELHMKSAVHDPLLYPQLSIVDPELAFTVPVQYRIDGMVDIMAHLIEPYVTGNNEAPVPDRITEGLIMELIDTAIKAKSQPDELKYQESLSYIAMLALSSIPTNGRTGPFPMHMLEHEISAYYDISHGRGLAITMIPFYSYVKEHRRTRLEKLTVRVFGERSAESGLAKLAEWLRILGEPEFLSDAGIDYEEDIVKKMVEDVIAIYNPGKDYVNVPDKLTREDLSVIYRKMFKHGMGAV